MITGSLKSTSLLVACLLGLMSCGDRAVIEQAANNETQETRTVEANILSLREAQDRLSNNPADKESLSIILNLLKDRNGVNRSNAAAVLGEVGEKNGAVIKDAAVLALISLAETGDEYDQYAAAKALRAFGPNAVAALPILRQYLSDGDNQKAWVSAEALGAMRAHAREAVPELVKAIKANQDSCTGDEPHICRFAAQALGNIGPSAAASINEIVPLLDHRNPYFRVYLAVAILRIEPKNQEALNALSSLAKDADVEVRRRTIWELKESGKEAMPAKSIVRAAATTDSDEAVRKAAAQLLEVLDRS